MDTQTQISLHREKEFCRDQEFEAILAGASLVVVPPDRSEKACATVNAYGSESEYDSDDDDAAGSETINNIADTDSDYTLDLILVLLAFVLFFGRDSDFSTVSNYIDKAFYYFDKALGMEGAVTDCIVLILSVLAVAFIWWLDFRRSVKSVRRRLPPDAEYYARATVFLAFYNIVSAFVLAMKAVNRIFRLAVKTLRIVITILGITAFIAIVAFIVSPRFRTTLEATWNHKGSLEVPFDPPEPPVLDIPNIYITTDLILWEGAAAPNHQSYPTTDLIPWEGAPAPNHQSYPEHEQVTDTLPVSRYIYLMPICSSQIPLAFSDNITCWPWTKNESESEIDLDIIGGRNLEIVDAAATDAAIETLRLEKKQRRARRRSVAASGFAILAAAGYLTRYRRRNR
ncbi:hypothetical protein RUND412_001971 [Rhizina undulata]